MPRIAPTILAVSLLASCSSAPMADKTMQAPAPGGAVLLLYVGADTFPFFTSNTTVTTQGNLNIVGYDPQDGVRTDALIARFEISSPLNAGFRSVAVQPGTYVIQGIALYPLWFMCLNKGSLAFEAKPGVVTYLGHLDTMAYVTRLRDFALAHPPRYDHCEFQRFPGLNTGFLDSGRSVLAGDAALAHRGVLLVSQGGSLSRAALDELSVVLHSGRAIPAWSKGGASIPAHPIIVLTVDAMETESAPGAVPNHLVSCFDMVAAVNSVGPGAFGVAWPAESSATVAARVDRARRFARRRRSISALAAALQPPCQNLFSDARARFRMDDAAMAASSRVARTIADLAGSPRVEPRHAAEALSFRHRRS